MTYLYLAPRTFATTDILGAPNAVMQENLRTGLIQLLVLRFDRREARRGRLQGIE